MVSRSRQFENINPQELVLLGYTEEKVLGQAVDKLVVGSDFPSGLTEIRYLNLFQLTNLDLDQEQAQFDEVVLGLGPGQPSGPNPVCQSPILSPTGLRSDTDAGTFD